MARNVGALRAKVRISNQQLYTDMRLQWLLSCHFDACRLHGTFVDLVPTR
jgi:hypothetical protein